MAFNPLLQTKIEFNGKEHTVCSMLAMNKYLERYDEVEGIARMLVRKLRAQDENGERPFVDAILIADLKKGEYRVEGLFQNEKVERLLGKFDLEVIKVSDTFNVHYKNKNVSNIEELKADPNPRDIFNNESRYTEAFKKYVQEEKDEYEGDTEEEIENKLAGPFAYNVLLQRTQEEFYTNYFAHAISGNIYMFREHKISKFYMSKLMEQQESK